MMTAVFLHGLFGRPADFARVRVFLQKRVRTVALDLPIASGHGMIDSVDDLVKFVSLQLVHLKTERLVLVGNSLGGHVAVRVALAHPKSIAGMVLSGSSGLFERGLERNIPRRPNRTWVAEKITEVFHDPAFVTDSVVDEAHATLHDRRRYRSVLHLARSAKQEDLTRVLPAVLAPTLLLWGAADHITPPDTAREFERLLPRARLIFLSACGHAPMLEKPRSFAFHVSAFLRDLSDR